MEWIRLVIVLQNCFVRDKGPHYSETICRMSENQENKFIHYHQNNYIQKDYIILHVMKKS